jgi:transposase
VVGIKVSSLKGRVSNRLGRPNYPIEFKRRLAEAACVGDVSVAKLALAHGVNANMLFKWRRMYRADRLGVDQGPAVLVPVATEPPAGSSETVVTPKVMRRSVSPAIPETLLEQYIEIEIGGAIVRLRGKVDPNQLRTVLRCLGPL